jgi:hypothetical protein
MCGMQYAGPRQARDAYGVSSTLDPWFVTGLAEGEGCFCVSFAVRSKLRVGLEARPSFRFLSTKQRPSTAGGSTGLFRLRLDPRVEERSNLQVRGSVGSRAHWNHRAALRTLPATGKQGKAFRGFAKVCRMIRQGDHLRREGMEQIVRIAYEMNVGKRRYSEATLLRALGEVKG